MAAVAQGIKKHVAFLKQSGLGVPAAGAGAQLLRRVTFVPTGARDSFDNPELASHEQSTGITYGLKKVSAAYTGVLSCLTFQSFFASLLRKAFAATSAYAAGNDVVAQVAAPQFTDTSAGFLAAGLKVGDVGRWTGFTTTGANNNGRNFLITALTAGGMTGVFLDGGPAIAKAMGDTVTFTLVGKKTLAPLTGQTRDYYTFEDWYSDISQSELLTDVMPSKADIALPATGNATINLDFVGLARTKSQTQVLTSPAAETATAVLTAVNGAVYLNGTIVGNCTGAKLTIDDKITAGDAVLGSNSSEDVNIGRINVSGEFTGLFDGVTVASFYDNETPVGLILVVSETSQATSNFITFTMGRIKITGDTPDDGEKQITRTYPFTAEININGGPTLAWDQTILTIQDSAAV